MRVLLLLAVLLTTPMLDAQSPLTEGKAGSPIRVVVYEDLQCTDCAALRTMMDRTLVPKYADRVAFVHRDFPLAKHAWARPAAIAARFFAEIRPELGLQFRRKVMAAIPDITAASFNDWLSDFARANNLPPDAAVAALKDQRLADLVEKDYRDGVARGVAKTPTVFVDAKPFVERFTSDEVSQAIDEALRTNGAPQP